MCLVSGETGAMTRLSLLLACTVLCAPMADAAPRQAPAAPAFAPKYRETIPLRYAEPGVVAASLNAQSLPLGVARVGVDPEEKHALRVLGTRDGLTVVKALVALLDVAPRKAAYMVMIERAVFGDEGGPAVTVVSRRSVILVHNKPISFVVTDASGSMLAASVTVRLPQTSGTPPTLLAKLGWRRANGSAVGLERAVPLPRSAAAKRVVGLTFADGSSVIGEVGTGAIPETWKEPFVAYYLSVRPATARPVH